jgi:hypothetical protein
MKENYILWKSSMPTRPTWNSRFPSIKPSTPLGRSPNITILTTEFLHSNSKHSITKCVEFLPRLSSKTITCPLCSLLARSTRPASWSICESGDSCYLNWRMRLPRKWRSTDKYRTDCVSYNFLCFWGRMHWRSCPLFFKIYRHMKNWLCI